MQMNGGSMFSTIASILFRPSESVIKSVDAVKKANNFHSGPVVGTSPSIFPACLLNLSLPPSAPYLMNF
jgi:hypothetical protein